MEHARQYGVEVLEGLPLAGTGPHDSGAAIVGPEPLLASCGFTATAHPSPQRVLMSRGLRCPDPERMPAARPCPFTFGRSESRRRSSRASDNSAHDARTGTVSRPHSAMHHRDALAGRAAQRR